MATFDEKLFRHVAIGPESNPNQPHRNPLPPGTYGKVNWESEQCDLRERAKEKLYEIIMHRAADFMKNTGQDCIDEGKRIAMVNISLLFTTNAADAAANGEAREHHKSSFQPILTKGSGQSVLMMVDDSEMTQKAIKQFNDVANRDYYGLACPHD